MTAGSVRRTLLRGGAVSSGALFVALAAGSVSLAGAVPASDGAAVQPLGTVTSVTSTATSTATSSLTLPTPEPETPATSGDGPVKDVVDTVTTTADDAVSTVTGLLAPQPSPTARPGSGGSTSGGSTPSVPSTVSAGTSHPVASKHHHTNTATASGAGMGVGLGRIFREPSPASTPANTTVTAAAQPQLTPNASGTPSSLGDITKQGLPAGIVIIAVVAFAAVAASHVGVWQNRLRALAG